MPLFFHALTSELLLGYVPVQKQVQQQQVTTVQQVQHVQPAMYQPGMVQAVHTQPVQTGLLKDIT